MKLVSIGSARRIASQMAHARKTWLFIVRSEDEDGRFEIVDVTDLATFFAGEQPIAAFGPDGREDI